MLIRSKMWIRFNGHAKVSLLTVTNDLKSTVTAPVVTAWTNWRRIADQVLLDALRTNLRAGLRLSFLLLKHLQLLYLKQFLGHQRRRFCGSFILVFSSEVWHLSKLWCTSVASLVICSVEKRGCFILTHFLRRLLKLVIHNGTRSMLFSSTICRFRSRVGLHLNFYWLDISYITSNESK